MTRSSLPVAIAIAACTHAPPRELAAAPAAPAAIAACPTGPALDALAKRAFGVPADAQELQAACVPMRAGGVRWLVHGFYLGALWENHVAIVDAASGAVLVTTRTAVSDIGASLDTVALADLDGDGTDELLRADTDGANGHAWESLHVHALRDGKLVEVGKLPVRYENTGAVALKYDKRLDECQYVPTLVDKTTVRPFALVPDAYGGKRVVITSGARHGRPKSDDCPKVGRHVYALAGGKLVEVTR